MPHCLQPGFFNDTYQWFYLIILLTTQLYVWQTSFWHSTGCWFIMGKFSWPSVALMRTGTYWWQAMYDKIIAKVKKWWECHIGIWDIDTLNWNQSFNNFAELIAYLVIVIVHCLFGTGFKSFLLGVIKINWNSGHCCLCKKKKEYISSTRAGWTV